MTVPVLLLLAGLLALGLPSVTRRDEKRFWHPWVNVGLLPMVLGLLLGNFLHVEVRAQLEPLLAAGLVAGGLLVGTQVRMAYLVRAGKSFLRRQSGAALAVFAVSAGLVSLLLWGIAVPGFPWSTAVAWGLCLAAFNLATAQMQLWSAAGFCLTHRDVVMGHIAPAGWWNLLAMALAGVCLTVLVASEGSRQVVGLSAPLLVGLEILAPLALGLALGWLAARSRNRDEAYLFLLATIACGAGGALYFGSAPLLTGLLVGAAFVNASLGRAAVIERALEDLEQPVAVAVGLLAGLVGVAASPGWQVWVVVAALFVLRLLCRGPLNPTSHELASPLERRLMTSGATGTLLAAGLIFTAPPFQNFFLPVVAMLVVQTLLAEVAELAARRRAAG